MRRYLALSIMLALCSLAAPAAQTPAAQTPAAQTPPAAGNRSTPTTVGDRSTPLRPITAAGNAGISNAVLRDQADVRAIRVVVEPGGKRATHTHDDVKFHLFVPVTGAMMLDLQDGQSVEVPAWQPYYMKAGTSHGFHNTGSSAVEILELFVK